jgi:hypothetical protein
MERGLVIYRIGKFQVNSVPEAEKILARAESGSNVDFTLGIITRGGRGHHIETVRLQAR